MGGDERYCVWGHNGYIKILVYTRKYNADKQCYEDCIRIEEPKAKVAS